MSDLAVAPQNGPTGFQIAKAALERGQNITETLREHLGTTHNTQEIIEIAYDLQAGSYVQFARDNPAYVEQYTDQLAEHLIPELNEGDSILDVGAGEFTNLSHLVRKLPVRLSRVYAFDLSFSRVLLGTRYAKEMMGRAFPDLFGFVAEISAIPLRSKSVDVVISNHSLEPNGGREEELLRELFRVARRKLVLFEPCYEINSPEGQARMDRLGYIKGLSETIGRLGGTLESVTPLPILDNPMNTTACYVIVPPEGESRAPSTVDIALADPGRDSPLRLQDHSYFSPALGVSYPVLAGIPVLRRDAAIVTSIFAAAPESEPTP